MMNKKLENIQLNLRITFYNSLLILVEDRVKQLSPHL